MQLVMCCYMQEVGYQLACQTCQRLLAGYNNASEVYYRKEILYSIISVHIGSLSSYCYVLRWLMMFVLIFWAIYHFHACS
ncbi:hypothetical protein OPV22_006267 [Ensete ventricosum]|uniref:Uncharacterized protein n=1 Tax=Ensete ventricosum TaxID=4639 RepID=A0AAV8RRC7_ENSVE|nr:hypothetical protein OPV22_006267 [Ensete ventricosum]